MNMFIKITIVNCKSLRQSLTHSRTVWVCGVVCVAAVLTISDTVSAQGPLRRLGDRIRERAGGPIIPGMDAPVPPASPLGRRPLLGRPQPPVPAPGNPAAVQQPSTARGQVLPTRSANYNRAASSSQRSAAQAASRVEQSSAWESRQDLRGSASSQAAPPSPPQPEVVSPPASRARLGVVVDTPPVVTPPGLPPRRQRGALVSEVQPNSAAEVAGITVGDLIVGVDGRVITSVRDLTDHLSDYEPGDEARFQIARQDQLVVTDVMLAGPDGIAMRRPEPNPSAKSGSGATSIMGGLGAAIGGLFGGSADGNTESAPQVPAENNGSNSPTISPETVRNSLPESLPPPVPEKAED